jgi:hypothetical protein
MTLHALTGKRELVTGQWITRCGRLSHRDTRPLPRGAKVGEQFVDFDTALHERDVDCPGCRIPLSAVGAWALEIMATEGARLRCDAVCSVNRLVAPPIIYMPKRQIDYLVAAGLVADGEVTPLGKSLARRL